MSTDWRRLAHEAADEHVAACQEALWHQEYGSAIAVESPAVGPYCGCTTCDIRETLAGAWPVIERMVAEARQEQEQT